MSTTIAVKVSFFTAHGEHIRTQWCASVPRRGDCVRLSHSYRVDAVVWVANNNDSEGVLQPCITLTPNSVKTS